MLIRNFSLWTDIDFSGSRKAVPSHTLRQYVKRSQGKLKRLAAHQFSYEQQAVLKYVLQRSRDLQELYLHQGPIGSTLLNAAPSALSLRNLILSSRCDITLDTVNQLLERFTCLERAEFFRVGGTQTPEWRCDMPALRCLKLYYERKYGHQRANGLYRRIPCIRTLHLRNWHLLSGPGSDFSALTDLEHLDLEGCNIGAINLPSSLRELNLAECFPGFSVPLSVHKQRLPNFVHLELADCCHVNPEGLCALLESNKGNFLHLGLNRGCFKDRELCFFFIEEGYFDNAQQLMLQQWPIDDGMIELMVKRCTNIRHLDLGSTKITGVGVKAIVTSLKGTLEDLSLDSCTSISIDAVDFARSMGVKVSFNFPENSRTGKKVRAI